MAPSDDPIVRDARRDDVPAICGFGEAHIPAHYAPLIGVAAAEEQVRRWWSTAEVTAAVAGGLVIVAESDRGLLGVGQRGHRGDDHVVYKLYVHPEHRGHGLGLRLLDALIGRLPADADRVLIEHFAANERAGAFYEREGFAVERVDAGPTDHPALRVVWRVRRLRTAPPA